MVIIYKSFIGKTSKFHLGLKITHHLEHSKAEDNEKIANVMIKYSIEQMKPAILRIITHARFSPTRGASTIPKKNPDINPPK